MRRRRIWVIVGVLVAALLVLLAVFLRKRAAPEVARLLPDSEAVLYVNLSSFRLVSDFGASPMTVSHEPEYAKFIQETGIQFERDLEEAAIAVHPAEPTLSPDGKTQVMQRRFSEIFKARFDTNRLNHYLHKLSSGVERYQSSDIFTIPYEGRIVRVAILGVDAVAASNVSDASVIRGMIDRHRKIALPFVGQPLLQEHYRDVPLGSSAWAIAALSSPDGKGMALPLPGGVEFQLPAKTVTVASLRYLGSIQFRAEAFTANEADAQRLAESLSNFLNLFRSLESSVQTSGADADVKKFFDSIQVDRKETRAVLTAELPLGFIKKAFSESPKAETKVEAPSKAAEAEKVSGKKKKK
ncbi:MAG TPA: hypothetical protein VM056_06765 [Terriglobales bacterium]|nr:hypothetical protein [Terriglobales bacterium]